MDWLTNLLGMAGNSGSSPFGALGGILGGGGQPPGGGPLPGSAPLGQGGVGSDAVAAMQPQAGAAVQPGGGQGPGLPGILGNLMQQKRPAGGNSGPLLSQAMSMLLQPKPIQQPQWMQLQRPPGT